MQIRQICTLDPQKIDYTENDLTDIRNRLNKLRKDDNITQNEYNRIVKNFLDRYSDEYILNALNSWL